MRFSLTWDEAAQGELADIWMYAPDRQDVTRAANEIDRLLRLRPLVVGEEFGTDRTLAVPPLEVLYTVSPDDCRVWVRSVWRT
jgi:hypothetical protein